MKEPRYAIFPGILISITVLVLLARAWTPPATVEAATEQAPAKQNALRVETAQTTAEECSFSANLISGVKEWCSAIEEISIRYRLEASLVAAVMTQESGGQSDVISASGAVGLMQVMPSDGAAAQFMCANGPCFASRPATEKLLDPLFNLDYGSRMLAGLMKKFGNVRDALKAYGPYNVGYDYADKVLAIQAAIES